MILNVPSCPIYILPKLPEPELLGPTSELPSAYSIPSHSIWFCLIFEEGIFSVSNSGAKAPEWRFWTSQWRLKFSGAGRFLATLKNNLRIIMIMKLFCSFEFFWENLLHKNAMKITRRGHFCTRKLSNCGVF